MQNFFLGSSVSGTTRTWACEAGEAGEPANRPAQPTSTVERVRKRDDPQWLRILAPN